MRPRKPQPLLIRLTHWVHIPVFAIMAMSGLQILAAYPFFGPRGEMWDWVPLAGWDSPAWLRAGTWLAGARHLHFAFAWALVINALIYLVYLGWSGEWRRLRIRAHAPATGFYNALQRHAYTGALVLGLLEVLSGFALWKPVQLHRLTWLLGGYDSARVIHWLALLGLVAFAIAHVVMVLLHPKSIVEMVTGGTPAEPATPAEAAAVTETQPRGDA